MPRLLAPKLLPQQGLAYDAYLVQPRPPRTRSESAGLAPVRPGRVNGRHSGWGRRLTSTTKCWTAPSARVGRVRVGQACSVKHGALVRDCVHAVTLPLRSTLDDNGDPFPCNVCHMSNATLLTQRCHARRRPPDVTRRFILSSSPVKQHEADGHDQHAREDALGCDLVARVVLKRHGDQLLHADEDLPVRGHDACT